MSRWKIGGWKKSYRTERADVDDAGSINRSVCLLTNAYPDFPESNRVVFMRDLAHELCGKDWKVSVIAPRVFDGSRRNEQEDGIQIRRFPSCLGGKLLIEYRKTPVLRLIGYMLSGMFLAAGHVRKNKPQLLHAHWVIPAGLIALIVGKIFRTPVVVTAHGSDILVIPRRNILFKKLAQLVLTKADAVTSVAEHVTAQISALGIQPKEIVTFPMSVPAETFAANKSQNAEPAPPPIVFSNRNLYSIYDVQLLIKAAPLLLERLPVEIYIAGRGPELDNLVSLTAKLGVSEHVRFLGEIPHEQMPAHLQAATAYVSTALSDGASVSLLEAMACGITPVVADIPANREWITDGENGFLFPPGDARALAEKVEQCLMRPDVRQRARELNVDIVQQRAQWNLNADKLLNLYGRVIARRKARAKGSV